jgi:hypothetical protein
VRSIKQPLDDTSEKQKLSDKDQKADFDFSQIMEKGITAALPSKIEMMQATQNLVDKRILAPLTLVKDSNQGNPLRNKVKKKKRLLQELAKFDEELLSMIPPEKLASLLENKMEQGDSEAVATSLRNELKQLVNKELFDGSTTQKEIVKVSVAPGTNHAPTAQRSSHNAAPHGAGRKSLPQAPNQVAHSTSPSPMAIP